MDENSPDPIQSAGLFEGDIAGVNASDIYIFEAVSIKLQRKYENTKKFKKKGEKSDFFSFTLENRPLNRIFIYLSTFFLKVIFLIKKSIAFNFWLII